jgi:protein ImuA
MSSVASNRARSRAEVVHELRRLLARGGGSAEARTLAFGLPILDAHLPQGGLSCGALHEIAPAADGDTPAAFGFVAVTLGRMLDRMPNGPVLLVTSPRGLAGHGRPHGHGLNGFGLDPARIILVEAADDKRALWAVEEALRSAVPTAVAGVIEKLDFRASQRLHLAAGDSGRPLLLLRPAGVAGSSVAVTRWRVAAARAAHDHFGLIARWRWQVRLERCRNGRPGQWVVEFDHATHRFSLAAALADPAFSRGAGAHPLSTLPRLHVLPSLPRKRKGVRAG